MLAAQSKNIGSCWLGAINRDAISELFNIPSNYEINSVIALGYPAENPVYEEISATSGNIKYYLDDNDQLHVPKRSIEKICHLNSF